MTRKKIQVAYNATQALNNGCYTDKHDKGIWSSNLEVSNQARNQLTAEETMKGMTDLLETERGWSPLSSGVKMPDFEETCMWWWRGCRKASGFFSWVLIMSIRKMRWLRRLKQARWRDAPPPVMSTASTRSPGNGTHVPLRAENRWAALNQEGTSTNPFIVLVFRV